MSEIQQQDEIKSTYSYDDWWEGRIFYGPWGQLSVDAYFDSTKKLLADPNYDPFKSDSPKAAFKTIRWCIPTEEFEKITAKQKELFNEEVDKQLKVYQQTFLKRFQESTNKPRLLNTEIETYEKLFYEEKLPITLRSNITKVDLGNLTMNTISIGSIREMYHERIVNGKKDYSMVKSPNCHFGVGGGPHQIIQVEAYAKYFDWLKEFNRNMTVIPSEGKYFSYTFPEVFTGAAPISKHQIIFHSLQRQQDNTLKLMYPDDNNLTLHFLNHIYQTDVTEIEDYLNFHLDQYSGSKTKWLRFFESRWLDRITDYKTGKRSLHPHNKYVETWLNNKLNEFNSTSNMKVNLLEPFEKMMDARNFYSLFQELQAQKEIEVKELEEHQREKGGVVLNYTFHMWVNRHYLREAVNIQQQIKIETQNFDNPEKVRSFINQQYAFVKGLIRKNADLSNDFSSEADQRRVRIALLIGLDSIKKFIEEDYETFLDNNDRHKVTIFDFEHQILHRYLELHNDLYQKKDDPDSTYPAKVFAEAIEEAKTEKLLDFRKRYNFIVKNWIAYNRDLGNAITEKEFIKFTLNRFSNLIKHDSVSGNYIGEDHQMKRFEFSADFYKNHVAPLMEALIKFLNTRLTELELSTGNSNQLPLLKWSRNDVDLLEFVTAIHLTGAINNEAGNLTRSEAIEFFENLFGIKIKDAESKLSKATVRKRSKHPFLDELVTKFAAYCENKDALKPSDN